MFIEVRNYVQANNAVSVGEIIRFADGNAVTLLPELAVQVLVESNSTRVGAESILRAWDLMMMLTERYAFPDQIYLVLRSYFLAAAALPAVDLQIRQKATICLLRLRSGPRPTRDDVTMEFKDGSSPVEYMHSCTSMSRIFGVSLAEILFKEEVKNVARDPDVVVPKFVRVLFRRLIETKACSTEGLFRVPGAKREEDEIVKKVNAGDWEFGGCSITTLASLTKRFFRDMQDELIPVNEVRKCSESEPGYKCVTIVMALPNHHRDTIMYFIGFLQYLLKFQGETKMTALNLVICLSSLFSRLPPPTSLADSSLAKTLNRIIVCLIRELDTSEVFSEITVAADS
jgi:hypothetical protein